MKSGWIIGGAALATGLFGWLSARNTRAPTSSPIAPSSGSVAPTRIPLPSTASDSDQRIAEWVREALSADYLNITCRQWQALDASQKTAMILNYLVNNFDSRRQEPWIVVSRGSQYEESTLARAVEGTADLTAMRGMLDEACALVTR